jgi:hypothetical protein
MHWVGTKAVTMGGGGGVVETGGYKGGKVVQLWTRECEVCMEVGGEWLAVRGALRPMASTVTRSPTQQTTNGILALGYTMIGS